MYDVNHSLVCLTTATDLLLLLLVAYLCIHLFGKASGREFSGNLFTFTGNRHMGPVGRVASNFGGHGDQVYLVPSNVCNCLSFLLGNMGSLERFPQTS